MALILCRVHVVHSNNITNYCEKALPLVEKVLKVTITDAAVRGHCLSQMRGMWVCYMGAAKVVLSRHRADMTVEIKKALGERMIGYMIKLDKISLRWTLEQVQAAQPEALFTFMIAKGILHADKGNSVSLMLLATKDGNPMPTRVTAKREREGAPPAQHPRHKPIVMNDDDTHPSAVPAAPRGGRSTAVTSAPKASQPPIDDSHFFASTLAVRKK